MDVRENRLHSEGIKLHPQEISAFFKLEIRITNNDFEIYHTIISKTGGMHASMLI